MKLASTVCLPALILGVLSLIFAEVASAQVPQLNDLASKIIKEVKPLKPRLIAVVDFRPPYGVDMPQGHYFAWLLSTIIEEKEKKLFVVAEHPAFDADLKRLRLTADALVPGDSLLGAAPVLGAEVLIIGTIERVGNHYALRVVPVRVASSEPLMAISAVIDTSEFLESMLIPLPAGVPLLTAASQAPDINIAILHLLSRPFLLRSCAPRENSGPRSLSCGGHFCRGGRTSPSGQNDRPRIGRTGLLRNQEVEIQAGYSKGRRHAGEGDCSRRSYVSFVLKEQLFQKGKRGEIFGRLTGKLQF